MSRNWCSTGSRLNQKSLRPSQRKNLPRKPPRSRRTRRASKRTNPSPSYWNRIVSKLHSATDREPLPSVSQIAHDRPDPFRVLISTMISLRTKDDVTSAASNRLFAVADTARTISHLSRDRIAKLIYPAGFYNTKAENIRVVATTIHEEFGGDVPQSIDSLTTLPGVGRKTANLVLGLGFGIPSICVDTHVHRIANRFGWVKTKTPDKTEFALRDIVPKKYWIDINGLLVSYGQRICTPTSPHCSTCTLAPDCPKVDVLRHR